MPCRPCISAWGYFNPLSPHGERPITSNGGYNHGYISIHSPRMGRDAVCCGNHVSHTISIHSPRMGRDRGEDAADQWIAISIHSPRMGRDGWYRSTVYTKRRFQSTLPAWGETGVQGDALIPCAAFQSTLPAWGETREPAVRPLPVSISIHSPRMGRDLNISSSFSPPIYFNPLSPHGERPEGGYSGKSISGDFNPLSPHGERR